VELGPAALHKFAAMTTAPALAALGWAQGRATTLIVSKGNGAHEGSGNSA
jgi:hypothetical protein